MSTAIAYPHISSDPDICGGVPCIAGSRIPVRTIGAYAQAGISPQEIVEVHYPWLTLSEVFSALSYFYDHFAEVVEVDFAEAA
jgi:uncharacterized protein (DUF433 family)